MDANHRTRAGEVSSEAGRRTASTRRPRACAAAPLAVLVAGLAAACGRATPCNDHAACKKGAQCWCDGAGRLVLEERDANGDGQVDRIRTVREADGRITRIESDWNANGSIERRQEFTYAEDGKRLTSKGWLVRCGGEKFHWSCNYDPPCPPPWESCHCLNEYQVEDSKGACKPLGQHGDKK